MKKFVLLFCFFISISCLAQQRHLTFMGIPIDGTINTFEAKLKSKGMLPNTETNKSLPFGKRMFRGVYIGRNVNITVNYTGKTKTVYSIEIGFADENQNIVNNFESDFIEGVKENIKIVICLEKIMDQIRQYMYTKQKVSIISCGKTLLVF